MKLNDWLIAQNLTSAEFARIAGLGDKQAVHKYRHGERFPTPENLRRIREATNGAVMPDDFVDQHAGESPPFVAPEPQPAPEPPTPKPARKPAAKRRPPRRRPAPAARQTAPKAPLAAAEP
jgi:transcriptional regulator with XRE-family HTH domain